MPEIGRSWAFPPELQPSRVRRGRLRLRSRALDSVVSACARRSPSEAFTAGDPRHRARRQRRRHPRRRPRAHHRLPHHRGARPIWAHAPTVGAAVEGHPIAYDQATGFGLVQPLAPVCSQGTLRAAARAALRRRRRRQRRSCVCRSRRARRTRCKARLRDRKPRVRRLLGSTCSTRRCSQRPRIRKWSGAALVDDGRHRLIGVGSLLVCRKRGAGDEEVQGNMFVPIDPAGAAPRRSR